MSGFIERKVQPDDSVGPQEAANATAIQREPFTFQNPDGSELQVLDTESFAPVRVRWGRQLFSRLPSDVVTERERVRAW